MKFHYAAFCVVFAIFLSVTTIHTNAQDNVDDVTIHVVQRGENLFRIALRYGVTVDDLARLNGIINPGNIKVGQRLIVPREAIPEPTSPPVHTVQPGETLQSIAQFYGVSTEEIIALNNLPNPNAIYVGQVLNLASTPAAPPTDSPPATPLPPSPEPVEASPPTEESSSQNLIHVVSRGETLFKIATRYGLTVNELARANDITDPTRIYAGQQLIIPGLEAPQLALDLPEPFAAIEVAPQVLMEGKTARFRITTAAPTLLNGTFLGRDLQIAAEENQTRHTILQGIPLFTEAAIYPLQLIATDVNTGVATPFELNLEVVAGPYGSEYIQLLADRGGLLDPAIEENELDLLRNLTATFTPERYFQAAMGLPAAATIISPFGTRRSYNGGPFDRFHSGTDFAGAPGTPVIATAPGRVVLADMLNVRGMATVIDHGWGVYTGYWHQSQQYVEVGQIVSTGDVIGAIGSTGRVTGAHLHWELWVGGVPVDPMQWVRNSF